MYSKIACNGISQIDLNDSNTFLPIRASSHCTSSFSSISSLSSYVDSPLFSSKSPPPSTRIPFSWEKLPGIPRNQISKEIDASSNLLPLPPAGNQFPSSKLNYQEILTKKCDVGSFTKDPFFAAFVECSKDIDDSKQYDPLAGKLSKITKSLSQGFSLVSTSMSCKSTCSLSDSMALVPMYRKNKFVFRRLDGSSKNSTPT